MQTLDGSPYLLGQQTEKIDRFLRAIVSAIVWAEETKIADFREEGN